MAHGMSRGVTCKMRWDRVVLVRAARDESEEEWPKDEILYGHFEREIFIGLFGPAPGDAPTFITKYPKRRVDS